jgi:feruloyl esterase
MIPFRTRVGRFAVALGVGTVAASTLVVGAGANPSAAACEALRAAMPAGATVVSAQLVAPGAFTPPGARAAVPFSDLPAFCRVATSVKTAASEVKSEAWLPANWNGDFEPAGSSFWGGALPYERMRAIVRSGAATVGSNLGIEGAAGPSFVIDHPERLANLGNEPFHAAIDQGSALIKSYYKRAPGLRVMDECGGGGSRDGLAEVQRWPADLDAVAATSFTNYGTHHGLAQMWLFQATHATPDSFIPPAKYDMLHKAVLAACDVTDGVADGVIEDPPHCAFDPGVLQCAGADSPTCLTKPQVEAVRHIYTTPVHARTKQPLYGPMVPGSELSWPPMTAEAKPYPYSESFYKYVVFKDPNWDFRARPANFDADVDRADAPQNLAINATNPDIRPFVDRGGKLLLLAGWNDDLGPGNNITYYQSVVAAIGAKKAREAVRLFMIPGMHHCLGIDYPSTYTVNFDAVAFLRRWKRTGQASDRIVVRTQKKGETARSRVVCAYPAVSRFKGNGSIDNPESFECAVP